MASKRLRGRKVRPGQSSCQAHMCVSLLCNAEHDRTHLKLVQVAEGRQLVPRLWAIRAN